VFSHLCSFNLSLIVFDQAVPQGLLEGTAEFTAHSFDSDEYVGGAFRVSGSWFFVLSSKRRKTNQELRTRIAHFAIVCIKEPRKETRRSDKNAIWVNVRFFLGGNHLIVGIQLIFYDVEDIRQTWWLRFLDFDT
jgi:hypothetical protein